jgi:hypothetical protein
LKIVISIGNHISLVTSAILLTAQVILVKCGKISVTPSGIKRKWYVRHHHHHHQPINVLTARAQAFLMDYALGKRVITHHESSASWWVLTAANAAATGGAQDNKFLVTHPMTD